MQYIRELAEYNGSGRAAVTFGKFDGLHRGHQVLVTKVRELGEQENINSIVCSFDMRPLWKERGITPELLMVGEERQERVKDEVDYLIECPFTESFRQKSAEDFIQEIIHDLFHHGILCKCPPPRVEAFTKRVTENGVNNNEFT